MTAEQLKEITAKLAGSEIENEIENAIDTIKKSRAEELPDVETIKKELDPKKHRVFDENYRKDKSVKADEGEEADAGVKKVATSSGTKDIPMKKVKVTRIGLAYQEIIVNRAAGFLFGFPVEYDTESEDNAELEVLKALKRVIHDNKLEFFDREIAKECFSYTEVAELWYPQTLSESSSVYGFDSKFKLKLTILKPSENEKFYPTFDEFGDLIAFSRAYSRKQDGKTVEFFETYTAEFTYRLENSDGWKPSEGYPVKNPINKIPIVYGRQGFKEWDIAQNIIENDEDLRSNFSDINKYHAAPTMAVKGKVQGFAQKGEAGKVIQLGDNAEAKYLEWRSASESVQLEHTMNREDIYSLTQTPDISFNNVKNIGNLGVGAQKMLFMDAHLKVQNKLLLFGPYLQRRINIIKAYLAMFNTSMAQASNNVIIRPSVTPYIIGDDKETADILSIAVSSGFMSRKTAIANFGWSQDAEKEFTQIQEEERAANMIDNFPPAQ